ncbi:MAG: CPBP family intramembrane metalloprotease [Phycisphaeraceae bacterium]|nr:CPBP family intramembrane metalloprotease [Phycisphaeraceae bacterium]
MIRSDPKHATATLVVLTLLPLAVIGMQMALGLSGVLGYSLYKLFLLIPPVIYCRMTGLKLGAEVCRWRHARQRMGLALGLGVLAVLIFWGVYAMLGDLLLDKPAIVAKIRQQFSVTPATVWLIAPVTIFANSLLEEFFYRAFTFGQLVRCSRWLGWLLPAAAFTAQHVLFIYHWMTPLPLGMAIGGLFIFALILQRLYQSADSIVAPWAVHILGDVAMMGIAVSLLW